MHIDGYDEMVTAANFDQLTQMYADVGFTPGSTAKKDFIGAMTSQLISQLQQGGSWTWLKVGNMANQSLISREVQLWSADKPVLDWLDNQSWSGRLVETKGDYLRVVDANMSANKSNYYVQRSTTYEINVDRNNGLHSVAAISWKHNGDSATWPGGDYTNYVRLYVPKGSHLTSWTGFDQDGVSVSEEGDKTVFGGMLKIPYGSTRQVEVRYDLPDSLSLKTTQGKYQLIWQKQSGLAAESVAIQFNTPLFLKAEQLSGNGVATDQKVVWTGSGNRDMSISGLFEGR
jgi:hypothetical protein